MTAINRYYRMGGSNNTEIFSISLCNGWKPLQKTTTNQNEKLCRQVPLDTSTKQAPHLTLRGHFRRGVKRLKEQENRGVCCEIVSPCNVRS